MLKALVETAHFTAVDLAASQTLTAFPRHSAALLASADPRGLIEEKALQTARQRRGAGGSDERRSFQQTSFKGERNKTPEGRSSSSEQNQNPNPNQQKKQNQNPPKGQVLRDSPEDPRFGVWSSEAAEHFGFLWILEDALAKANAKASRRRSILRNSKGLPAKPHFRWLCLSFRVPALGYPSPLRTPTP